MRTVEADYLVVGAGAMGMAFIDTLASETDARVVVVERREVCAYYDHVMRQKLLPTGRVSYFPMSEYRGDGRFVTLAGTQCAVAVTRRLVDATHMRACSPRHRPKNRGCWTGSWAWPARRCRPAPPSWTS
ncbi:hypothetical protein AWC19_12690 [Mycobacterium palustre]|uniref:FAD/NAD(P)-binding domain-containing protein n=1 Tax=Mycobacterium palustre TaxID=153971 RepID=A0A1X1ZH39_9MYCO|nr:hypothetical protein AWC19_12690 [Mycobacterium palustre]